MRALLVYNPNATTTNPAVTDAIARALSAELKLDVEATKRPGHAAYLAAGAVQDGHEVVVALGGDGTLNEVVQGVAETPVKLAVLPGGSTNVFLRTLGVPTSPMAATAFVLRKLRDREDRRVALGLANNRYFAFCAGWGYDAEVVRMVERRVRMKHTFRQATFLWCGLLAQLAGRSERTELTLTTDGAEPVTGLRNIVCCNSNPYSFLGPLPSQMCPDAELTRGLDVTAMTRANFADLARVMRAALSGPSVPGLPRVRAWHDRTGYDLTSSGPLPLQVDGEFVGEPQTVALRSVPNALTVVG